jgi:HD-GYP domain-containing protein (c-di-GMP phosphodiesterase class II)
VKPFFVRLFPRDSLGKLPVLPDEQHHPFEATPIPLEFPARNALSLSERFGALHSHLRRAVPTVDRMAVALYDPEMDHLKTFVNSTIGGEPLRTYQYKLADSPSLVRIKEEREPRIIDDIGRTLTAETEHTRWVKSMGYRSSYTVPIFHQGVFEGFLFFDSRQPAAFTPDVVARLGIYVNLIMLMVSHELTTVRALLGSVQVARDFTSLRDEETGAHLDRMSRFCRLIARGLAKSHDLSDEFIEQLFLFSPLHDIGKVGIPDAVLRKPGSFTPEERKTMESHVQLGSRMVDRLVDDFDLGTVAGISILRNLVAFHHEFLDGSGYPHGAVQADIPIEARIVTVADIFDALTSKRVYKEPWTVDAALAALDGMVAEGKLDADCVAALRANREEAAKIIERFGETPPQT